VPGSPKSHELHGNKFYLGSCECQVLLPTRIFSTLPVTKSILYCANFVVPTSIHHDKTAERLSVGKGEKLVHFVASQDPRLGKR